MFHNNWLLFCFYRIVDSFLLLGKLHLVSEGVCRSKCGFLAIVGFGRHMQLKYPFVHSKILVNKFFPVNVECNYLVLFKHIVVEISLFHHIKKIVAIIYSYWLKHVVDMLEAYVFGNDLEAILVLQLTDFICTFPENSGKYFTDLLCN